MLDCYVYKHNVWKQFLPKHANIWFGFCATAKWNYCTVEPWAWGFKIAN